VGGLYPCRVLSTQAKNGKEEEDTLYTVLVMLDHDIMNIDGIDYDENDIVIQESARNQGQLTRRQMQLVKDVPLRALRGITQAWRNQGPVDHLRDADDSETREEEVQVASTRTPAPFRHFIGVDDDVFPDAWKDLRSP
jgi:hypothetical protein